MDLVFVKDINNSVHILIGSKITTKNANLWYLAPSKNLMHHPLNGLDWQCCFAGSSKAAPRILIFSIAMGANYSFYVKTIETHFSRLSFFL